MARSRLLDHPASDKVDAAERRVAYRPDALAEEIDAAIAFLDSCFGKKPGEAVFRRALGYNVRVPATVRRAIAGWSTAAPLTIEALRRVTVPVLITHGRRDSVVLPAAAEMTASTIPHARLSWFDDCGHSPFVEDATRFNAELAAFVQATPRP